MSHEIAVTGSVAFDHIMNFKGRFKDHILPDKLHMLNVSFLVNELRRLYGGCAANVAYACALHGLRPRLVASVGSDFADYGRWLSDRNIDLSGVQTHTDCLTASCFITTDADNNQITGFFPGAMARAKTAMIGGLSGKRPAIAIVSPNDPEAMKAYPKECRKLGVPFLFDPGQNVIALSKDDLVDGLTGARVLVCNDYEIAVVKEKTGLDEAGLLERCEAVVIPLGKEGSRILPRGQDPVEVPCVPVEEVVDPTGAGDAYRGGLIRGLVDGADWETCARLGTLTATYCVEVQGTTGYAFDPAGFARRYEDAFGVAAR